MPKGYDSLHVVGKKRPLSSITENGECWFSIRIERSLDNGFPLQCGLRSQKWRLERPCQKLTFQRCGATAIVGSLQSNNFPSLLKEAPGCIQVRLSRCVFGRLESDSTPKIGSRIARGSWKRLKYRWITVCSWHTLQSLPVSANGEEGRGFDSGGGSVFW